jgi:hypothetical protein
MILSDMRALSKSVFEAGVAYNAYRLRKVIKRSPIGIYRQLFYSSYLLGLQVGELVRPPYPSLVVLKKGLENRVYMKVVLRPNWRKGAQTECLMPIANDWEGRLWGYLISFRYEDSKTLDFSKLNQARYPVSTRTLYKNLRKFLDLLYVANPPLGNKEYGFGTLRALRVYDLSVNSHLDMNMALGKLGNPKLKPDLKNEMDAQLKGVGLEDIYLGKSLQNSMTYAKLINLV